MQKKGSSWMTEETGKFFISLLVILLLILLIVTLGKMFLQNTEYEQAKATLGDLKTFMAGLSEGKEGYFLIEAPKNWNILSDGNSKLCICPVSVSLNDCESSKGVCESIEKKVLISSSCRFSSGLLSSLTTYPYCIQISKVPLNLRVFNQDENYLFNGFSSGDLDSSLNTIILSKELKDYFRSKDPSQLKNLLQKEFDVLHKKNENYESYQFSIRDTSGQKIFYYTPNEGFLVSTLEFSSAKYDNQSETYFVEFDMMSLKTGGFPFG